MIDGIVDAEETVVNLVVEPHLDGLVLGVVLLKVERELLLDLLGVDGGGDFLPSLVEHRQHGVVHIVVEQHDALLCRADKVGNKGVGVENLPVEEDALDRWQRGADKKVNFVLQFVDFHILFGGVLLECCNTRIDRISTQ